jgi:hypothetical protein
LKQFKLLNNKPNPNLNLNPKNAKSTEATSITKESAKNPAAVNRKCTMDMDMGINMDMAI